MKRLIVIGLLFTFSTAMAAAKRSQIEEEKALTVIVTNEGFTGSGRGTGILLDSAHVLTCAHMLEHYNDELFIYTYPLGKVIMAKAESFSRGDDLAVLVLASSVPTQGAVFQPSYQEGDAITVLGNALGGMKWFITKGVISGVDHDFLLTDAVVNPGNSGGPWFNAKGQVVAVTGWRIGPSEKGHYPGLAGGISARTIKDFLHRMNQKDNIFTILGG